MADRTVGSEFGSRYEIPGFIEYLVKEHYLDDMSWHNDISPSFGIMNDIAGTKGNPHGTSQNEIRIWVEHPLKSRREFQGERFTVTYALDGDQTEDYSFDELEDALKKLLEVIIEHWPEAEKVPGIWSMLMDDSNGDPAEALDILLRKYYR